MQNNICISVIIPVYNAERYLNKCVDSLLNQTFSNFEVLLIDDGSVDKSCVICDAYAKQDSRVKVFHKKNGGVASSRQLGLDNAKGDYIIHADPDDFVEKTMLEEMYQAIKKENADILITDFIYYYHNKQDYCEQSPKTANSRELIVDILCHKHKGYVWNKLIKRESIDKHNAHFIADIDLSEDDLFCVQMMKDNDVKIAYLPKAYYYYAQDVNPHSYTHNFTQRIYDSNDKFIKELAKYDFGIGYSVRLTEFALRCFSYHALSSREFYDRFNKEKAKFLKKGYNKMSYFYLQLSASGYQWIAYPIFRIRQFFKKMLGI